MNYRLWQREFGGDPKILNTSFILNGEPTTLVGIMPPQFNAFDTDFWQPFRSEQVRGAVIGRLRPGLSLKTAAADLDAIAHRVPKASRGGMFPEDKFSVLPETLLDSLIGNFKKTLYALLGAVLLLLLIACSNVANLFLARATARQSEIAMRATLGATRGRLIRQLLVESFVLALGASGVGCVLAYFGLKAVVALIPAGTLPVTAIFSTAGAARVPPEVLSTSSFAVAPPKVTVRLAKNTSTLVGVSMCKSMSPAVVHTNWP
jgi:putative ABC transport system permease protein